MPDAVRVPNRTMQRLRDFGATRFTIVSPDQYPVVRRTCNSNCSTYQVGLCLKSDCGKRNVLRAAFKVAQTIQIVGADDAAGIVVSILSCRHHRLESIAADEMAGEGIVWSDRWGFHIPGVEHPNPDFPVLSRPTMREMFAAYWDVTYGNWGANPWAVSMLVKIAGPEIDDG